jgi:hypothetical protein
MAAVAPDPGWPRFPALIFPMPAYLMRHEGVDGRRVVREITVSFVWAQVAMGLLAALAMGQTGGSIVVQWVVLGAVVVGAVGLRTWARRPLDCSSDAALVVGYQTRFFIRSAAANAVGLVGFVVRQLGPSVWPTVVGVAVAVVLLVADAPTAAALGREDAHLAEGGCGRSLVAALALGLPTLGRR